MFEIKGLNIGTKETKGPISMLTKVSSGGHWPLIQVCLYSNISGTKKYNIELLLFINTVYTL